jgi:signal peptidase I
MDWKPNKWLASLLNLFLFPMGMLYVARAKWAIFYLLVILLLFSFSLILDAVTIFSSIYTLVVLVSVVHVYLIASKFKSCPERPMYSRWYGMVIIFLGFLLFVFAARAFFYDIFTMSAKSMFPTIHGGSVMVVSKWGYGNYRVFGISILQTELSNEIKRGDVIVFSYPRDLSLDYVKRVVGLPGDHIAYYDKVLYINGEVASRSFAEKVENYDIFKETIDGSTHFISIMNERPSSLEGETVIPDNQYFVMGDNRDNSNDSRVWGYVPQENIIGKVISVY